MQGKIKSGKGRKGVNYNDQIIKKAISLSRQLSSGKTKGKADNQYVVNIDATQQGDIKNLWGEILQLISIIQNFFKGKSKDNSENVNIHIGGSSNGPDSTVVNITFAFNINNYNGKTE